MKGRLSRKIDKNRFAELVKVFSLSADLVKNSMDYRRLRKAEAAVHAVVDCLVYFEPRFFEQGESRNFINSLLKKVFRIALDSNTVITTHWKAFGQQCLLNLDKKVRANDLSLHNPFRSLYEHRFIQVIYDGQFEKISYLLQSRNFPEGDSTVAKTQLASFKDAVTKPYQAKPDFLKRVIDASRRIGVYCVQRGGFPNKAHQILRNTPPPS
jgi:hypothetical protein